MQLGKHRQMLRRQSVLIFKIFLIALVESYSLFFRNICNVLQIMSTTIWAYSVHIKKRNNVT